MIVRGIDIIDVINGTGNVSPARVLRVLSALGEDSAYWSAVRGGQDFRGWDYDRYAVTAQVDLLQNILFVLLKSNGAKKAKPPEPLPTPGENRKRSKGQNMFAAMTVAAMDGKPIEKWA